ncbi:MAG: hypothetical protein ACI8UD_000975 [Planctomycetota bacterium]|jgi:hypothetical protein
MSEHDVESSGESDAKAAQPSQFMGLPERVVAATDVAELNSGGVDRALCESGRRSGLHTFFFVFVVLTASWFASRVQNSFGSVQVRGISLPTHNGQWLTADLYKPRTATSANKAPLVVVVPGFQRSKEALGNVAIELSRRGIVVIAIDPYAQGNSSSSMRSKSATKEGYGMFAVVDYVHDTNNLNYVDKQRIGVTGHSAGGNAAIRGASYFGKIATKTGKPSKLHSVFVSGYMLTMKDTVLQHVRSNVGASYALYDEGAYRNENQNGDMRNAPEALRLVRSGLAEGVVIEQIEVGRYYGNKQSRTLRVMHNEPLLHPFQPYSPEATANQLQFFGDVFDLEPELAVHDQVWHWKELLTLVSLVAALLMLMPLARCLLRLPVFTSLVQQVPAPQPRPAGAGKKVFWFVFALSGGIACASFIPLCEWSQEIFVDASQRRQTWFFPQRMNNAVMMWAVLNGAVGFVLFFAVYAIVGRKHGIRAGMWGAGIRIGAFLKTGVLAVLLWASFFSLLTLVHYLFHVDYRFVFLGVRTFRAELLLLLPMYLPMFFVFFLANSLRMNGAMRFEGQSEWRSLLLGGLANTLGLLLILVMQYVTQWATGTVFWTDSWLYVNLLFGVVPIMFLLPLFNRWFFRMTGRIYLGPMTTCLVFVTILLSNTVCYLPL